MKRKTKEDSEPDNFKLPEIKARGKLAKKAGDRSIF